jgi:xanthine dehydrogenase iron-sulfur cluster and FAD-binding subunit A
MHLGPGASFHQVLEALADTLGGAGIGRQVKQVLVGFCVLQDRRRLAVCRTAQMVKDDAVSPLSDMRARALYRRTRARNVRMRCFPEPSEKAFMTRLVRA